MPLELGEYPSGFALPLFSHIEAQVEATQRRGRLPLWEGYGAVERYRHEVGHGAGRTVAQVRAAPEICRFYSWLVTRKRPARMLEFGAAFGVSGMYWLAGLEACGAGHLYSFEPNPVWYDVALANFTSVSPRFTLVNATFEAGISAVPQGVELALIDAIHTREFVLSQFALVRGIAAPGALILFDDIDFSSDMRRAWGEVRKGAGIAAAWEVGGRLGVIALEG